MGLFILGWPWQPVPYGGRHLKHCKCWLCMLWFFYLLYTNIKHPFKQWFWSVCKLVGIFLTFPSGFRILNSLNIPLSVETVCVFTAPIFSAFASWATYLLTKVCWCRNFTLIFFSVVCVLSNLSCFLLQEVKGAGAGLTAAVLLAMVNFSISFVTWRDC